MTRRYLALALPRLATDRLARAEPGLRDRPLALWVQDGSRHLLAAVNVLAARDLAPGMKLADATAMLPALVTRAAEPLADAALLDRLARWATRYTPLAATDGTDALVLDVFGCTHPHGTEAALLEDAAARLSRMGFAVVAAVAGSAAAALALARAGRHGAVVPAGGEGFAIAPLPLAVLGLAPELCARLASFGIGTAGALAAQPRGALSRRVGPAALAALDAALGRTPRPIRPLAPAAVFAAAEDFSEPILTAEAIAAALDRLMTTLCGQLARAGHGARRVTLSGFRTDGAVARIGIGTGVASREAGHLARLLRPRIERIDPGLGLDRLVLAADVTETLGANQSSFADGVDARAARRTELAQLVDRLRGRLGEGAVRRQVPRPSHIPERAIALADPFDAVPAVALPGQRRPVRLFDPPEPIDVVSLLPDGPPRRFRWRGRVIGVARAQGPERIAPEWWREPADAATRDYWCVEAEEGARFWLFRDAPARWRLHGLFG
jgi:protein ImuB